VTRSNVGTRALHRCDYDGWLTLWNGYNAFYGRVGPTALLAEVTQTTWGRLFDPAEPVHGLVAELNGRVVGLCHYLFHRSTISVAPVCYLQDLFTDEQSRGRGAGRALIEAVCQRATAAGVSRVYWQTHETNLVAQRLYDMVAARSGFIVYRRDTPVTDAGSDASGPRNGQSEK